MNSSEKILEKLIEEKRELNLYGGKSKNVRKRIEEIDFQIKLIKSGDSFREHELSSSYLPDENSSFNEEDDDNNYGYVSESFHDPDKDY